MKLSRESRYALIALTTMASKPLGAVIGAAALSEEANLPSPFLAKILQRLSKRGLLVSQRGNERGYMLARPGNEISVREVLEAIDGDDLFERCIFYSETCNASSPCSLHDAWEPMMEEALTTFTRMTLADVDSTMR